MDIMRITITGKNIELTDGLKEAVTERLSKLEKYFAPETEAHVTLSVEKERQKIEVTIPVKGSVIRAEQVSNDMYVSIEVVVETIERQLKKYRNKIVTKQQSAEKFFAQEYLIPCEYHGSIITYYVFRTSSFQKNKIYFINCSYS